MRYAVLMSYRDDEKRWERIREVLAAEATGKPVRPAVSQRTLFGIPSSVEQVIQKAVEEDEAARRAKRQRDADERKRASNPPYMEGETDDEPSA